MSVRIESHLGYLRLQVSGCSAGGLFALLLALAASALGAGGASAFVIPTSNGGVSILPIAGASPTPGGVGSRGARPAALRERNPLENPLIFSGGPTMPSSRNYLIYWAPAGTSPFAAGYQAGIKTYERDVAHDSGRDQNTESVLTQYYGPGGAPTSYQTSLGGVLTDRDPYPSNGCFDGASVCISAEQIEAELTRFVVAKHLQATFLDLTHDYTILLPPGINACFFFHPGDPQSGEFCSFKQFCAFHSAVRSTNESGELTGPALIFAVQPYNVGLAGCETGQRPNNSPSDAAVSVLSHEHAEMVTDPFPGLGWQNRSIYGPEEVADLCEPGRWGEPDAWGPALGNAPDGALYNQVINGHEYYTQQMWSDETNSCLQRRPLPPSVTGRSRTTGPAGGGTTVKITGLNFIAPSVTAVRFGSKSAARVTLAGATSLTAVSPPEAAGTVDITLTSSAGTSATVAADRFTFE